MTVKQWNLFTVECDDEDCGLRGPITSGGVQDALDLAARDGWKVTDPYRAFCPAHRDGGGDST